MTNSNDAILSPILIRPLPTPRLAFRRVRFTRVFGLNILLVLDFLRALGMDGECERQRTGHGRAVRIYMPE